MSMNEVNIFLLYGTILLNIYHNKDSICESSNLYLQLIIYVSYSTRLIDDFIFFQGIGGWFGQGYIMEYYGSDHGHIRSRVNYWLKVKLFLLFRVCILFKFY